MKRIWILLSLLVIGFSFSSNSMASVCVEHGGSVVGCKKPIGFNYVSSDGGVHSTLWGALHATGEDFIQSQSNPQYYNMGLRTSIGTWENWGNCTSPSTITNNSATHPDNYSRRAGSGLNAEVSFPTHIHGYRPRADCPDKRIYVTSVAVSNYTTLAKPICPAGYTARGELPQSEEDYGYLCIPGSTTDFNIANSNIRRHDEFSCEDTVGQMGQATTSMPVNIATRCKSERETDLQTNGPWPISWTRYVAQQTNRDGWRMGETGNLTESAIRSGRVWVSIRRNDGKFLLFSATPATNGPRDWESGMHSPHVFQSTLKDVWESGELKYWELNQANGETELYSSEGLLVRRVSSEGFNHHYLYDDKNRLEMIKDDFNHYILIGYSQENYPHSDTYTWEDENGNPEDMTSYYNFDEMEKYLTHLPLFVSDGTRVVEYVWDLNDESSHALANLNKVIFNDDSFVEYKYGETVNGKTMASHVISGVVDEEGRRILTYEPVSNSNNTSILREWKGAGPDGVGALNTLTINTNNLVDADGRVYSFTKGGNSTQSAGRIRTYSTPCPECNGVQGSNITYNSQGLVTNIRDWKNINTAMTYDDVGRILSIEKGIGTSSSQLTTYTYPLDKSIKTPTSMVEEVKNEFGSIVNKATHFVYSDIPVILQGECNSSTPPNGIECANTLRLMTSIEVEVDGQANKRITTLSYNNNGLLEEITRPSGMKTNFTWTNDGQVQSMSNQSGTYSSVKTFGGFNTFGPTWTNENGLFTRWARDGRGRIIREDVGVPGSNGVGEDIGEGEFSTNDGVWRKTIFSWFDNGLMRYVTHPNGTQTHFEYDGADNLTKIINKDNLGDILSTINMQYSPAGMLLSSTIKNELGQDVWVQESEYNNLQRVSKIIDFNNAETLLGYDVNGSLTNHETPLGHTSSKSLDEIGRPTTFTDALSNISNIEYGPSDEITSAIDQRGVTTNYLYNGFGDLVELSSPDRGVWSFEYNQGGQRVKSTDPRGVVQHISYDAMERPVLIEFDDSAVVGGSGYQNGIIEQEFVYDACKIGHLCEIKDNSGSNVFTYNSWGEVLTQTWQGKPGSMYDGVYLTTEYVYNDETGQVINTIAPSGNNISLTYGVDGNISLIKYAGINFIDSIKYNALDKISSWQWSQGVGWSGSHKNVDVEYDLSGRMIFLEDISEKSFLWDNDNRLIGVDDINLNNSQVYEYDAINQLTSADIGSWLDSQNYEYDNGGNRVSRLSGLSQNGLSYNYDINSNKMLSKSFVSSSIPGSTTYLTYDDMGNMISDGQGLNLYYDSSTRLSRSVNGSSDARFTYNALGQRVIKQVVMADTHIYIYDISGRPLGVYTSDSSNINGARAVEEYIYLDGWKIVGVARPDSTFGMSSPLLYPILTDHLNTPRVILDGSTGEERWNWDGKEPFGHQVPDENPMSLGVFEFNLRFPGQRYDKENGLYHNGFRDYHPGIGRYVQSDPIGLMAGWNTYSYVGSNPLWGIDVDGLIVVYKYSKEMGSNRGDVQYMKNEVEIMRNQSPTFKDMMETLENSPRTYQFLSMRMGNNAAGTVGDTKMWGLNWNINREISCGVFRDVRDFEPRSGLAHEVGHLYRVEQRILNNRSLRWWEIEEFGNLKLERKVHEEMGWPKGRTLVEYYLSWEKK